MPTARQERKIHKTQEKLEKGTRKKDRAKLGNLPDLILAKNTLTRYSRATLGCLNYLFFCGVVLSEISSERRFDGLVGEYLKNLWTEGEPKSYANMTVAAVQHFFPGMKHRLVVSWRLCSAWQRAEGASRVKPFTLMMVKGVSGWLWSQGEYQLAAFILVGFMAFPRTGELGSAYWSHFGFDLKRGCFTLCLPWTKGGQRRSAQETVVVRNRFLTRFPLKHFGRKNRGERFIDLTLYVARQKFKLACRTLGLPDGFSLYSLRREAELHGICSKLALWKVFC